MASDSIKELTQQVIADLVTVNGQVSGMEDHIAAAGDEPDLVAGLQDPPLAELNERRTDLETILADLRKLVSDIDLAESHGWPNPQEFTLSADLQFKFDNQNRNLAAATGLFHVGTMATSLDVQVGSPQPKIDPETGPPQRK